MERTLLGTSAPGIATALFRNVERCLDKWLYLTEALQDPSSVFICHPSCHI